MIRVMKWKVVNERDAGWLASVRYRQLIEWSGSCTNGKDQSSSASNTCASPSVMKRKRKDSLSAVLHWRLWCETEANSNRVINLALSIFPAVDWLTDWLTDYTDFIRQIAQSTISNRVPFCDVSRTCFSLYRPSSGRSFSKECNFIKFIATAKIQCYQLTLLNVFKIWIN
jgi:hypothetical protein